MCACVCLCLGMCIGMYVRVCVCARERVCRVCERGKAARQVGDSLMPLTLLTKLDRRAWRIYTHVCIHMLTNYSERDREREGICSPARY